MKIEYRIAISSKNLMGLLKLDSALVIIKKMQIESNDSIKEIELTSLLLVILREVRYGRNGFRITFFDKKTKTPLEGIVKIKDTVVSTVFLNISLVNAVLIEKTYFKKK